MEDSPKRLLNAGSREQAPSSSAPIKDMTIQELTHADQHLAAQAALDKQWALRVQGAVADHAQWLDRHSAAGISVAARLDALASAMADSTTTITTTDNGAQRHRHRTGPTRRSAHTSKLRTGRWARTLGGGRGGAARDDRRP